MAQGWQPLTTLTWKNSPDTTTPLNANNLNGKVSGFIGELDERTRTLDSVKLDVNDASGMVQRAEDGAENSEAYAIGTRNGTPVASTDPAYHNNSKYYSEQVGDEALKAEGYANGKQNGVPVGSSSPYYHNNAEYFKDQASQIAAQQLGALTDVTISSPQNGQVLTYNSTSQKWENGNSGGSNLNDLNDVTITSATNGQTLIFDGTAQVWKNASLGTASSKNVPASGDASSSEVVLGNDTRLSDARTPTAHNQAASTITAGTLAGKVLANATAVQTLGDTQVRNIYFGTTAVGATLAKGDIYFQYEE